MKLQVMSDLHVEFHARPPEIPGPDWDERISDAGADVLVLAGDIGKGDQGVRWAAQEADRLGVRCIYVPGNHEFYRSEYGQTLGAMRSAAAGTRVCLLSNNKAMIAGVRFLGTTLWTDLRAYRGEHARGDSAEFILERNMMDYHVIRVALPAGRRRPLRASDTVRWNRTAVAWLERELGTPFEGPTVVVTHHGPSLLCQHPSFEPDWMANGFHSPLEHLMDPRRVQLWIYGHTHASLDAEVNGVRLVSNQRGYPAEAVPGGFDPGKVIEI